jgi:hypothetical protein
VKRLEQAGFQVWLDERELRAGAALSQEIAKALQAAKVVIVIISPASIRSRWLKYELNLATERMVKGLCVVIPVVIADCDLPPEVTGLLYADFRKSFRSGVKSVLTSLRAEASRQAHIATLNMPQYQRVTRAVESVFGSISSASSFREYKSVDWNAVSISATDDIDETTAFYDDVLDYGRQKEPLTRNWLDEFLRSFEETGEEFAVIVTKRPIGFPVKRDASVPQVAYREYYGGEVGEIFVELAETPEERWKAVLERAKALLIETIKRRKMLKKRMTRD